MSVANEENAVTMSDYDEDYRAGLQEMRDLAYKRIEEREIAYQTYINELTPNGNTRLNNIILSAVCDRSEQHIVRQIDFAFQAGWSARADLATPTFAELKGQNNG